MLWLIYNLVFPVVFLFMLPKFLSRMLKRGGYGRHFEQRIGHFGTRTKARLREHRRVWVHAVSVGEIFVALRFMKAYRAAHPEVYFALSTTTSTGHAIARNEIDPRDVLFYFPVDLPLIVKKVLRIINPLRIVLVEGEFWPNLIRQADHKGIPISLINGRMSKKSYRRYRRLKSLTSDMLGRIDPVCVQGEVDARRMIALGAQEDRVHIMGTVKFDVAERDAVGEQIAHAVMDRILNGNKAVVLMGGSTWPGEEAILCKLYKMLRTDYKDLFLVLVPRHAERSDEVIQCLEEHKLSYARRSQVDDEAPGDARDRADVLLVDTTGELRNFYSVADLIFIGKSLTQHGGQNPIEPAMYGKAVVVGPNMENFPAVMEEFLRHEAILQIPGPAELESAVEELVRDPAARAQLGERAARVVKDNRGVIDRTVQQLRGKKQG